MKDLRNIEGLKRDYICALEHFQSEQKAQEYILKEFDGDYTEEEFKAVFELYGIGEYLETEEGFTSDIIDIE